MNKKSIKQQSVDTGTEVFVEKKKNAAMFTRKMIAKHI